MNYERVILEILDRIKKLEEDVSEMKKNCNTSTIKSNIKQPEFTWENLKAGSFAKDKTKYIFNGVKYSKRRLVLAVIKSYTDQHPNITINDLQSTFDASLQGSFGVIVEKEKAIISTKDYGKRFFAKPEEEIKLSDGICLVCSQWTLTRIHGFITRARQLGFEITELDRG